MGKGGFTRGGWQSESVPKHEEDAGEAALVFKASFSCISHTPIIESLLTGKMKISFFPHHAFLCDLKHLKYLFTLLLSLLQLFSPLLEPW